MNLSRRSQSQLEAPRAADLAPVDYTARRTHKYSGEDDVLKKKADECVEYIVFGYLAERKCVVRRAELNKAVLKEFARSYKTVIRMVDERLNDVFGLQLVELDAGSGSDKGEKYGLRSKFEYSAELSNGSATTAAGDDADLGADEDTSPHLADKFKYSMLMVALALIFMNDNELDADVFWDSLRKLDVSRDEKKHKYLGDVAKFFTGELVKDGYLEYEPVRGIEPPTYKFRAGFRARLEITKKSLLRFVCKMYGGADVCQPSDWTTQHADAEKSDADFAGSISSDVAAELTQNQQGSSGGGGSDDDDNDVTPTSVTQPRTRRH